MADALTYDPRRYRSMGGLFAKTLEATLKFTDGVHAGKPLVLEPWQRDFFDEAFLIDRRTGKRVYHQVWLCGPKGIGKTQIGAAFGLVGMTTDIGPAGIEVNPQVVVAAAAQKQAAELVQTSAAMALKSPSMMRKLHVARHDIYLKHKTRPGKYDGKMYGIASDADTVHGMKPSFALVDELGSHKKDHLYSTIVMSGRMKRTQPLVFVMSHVGTNRYNLFGNTYDIIRAHPGLEVYGGKQRNGRLSKAPALMVLRDRENGFLCYWYGVGDRDDLDVDDPRVWKLCNPQSWATIEDLTATRNSPPMRANPSDFRRWNLNQWVIGSDAFLPAGVWAQYGNEDLVIPRGAPVFLGMDGAKKHDHGAIAICWPDLSEGRNRPIYRIVVKLYRAEDSETSIVSRMRHDVLRMDQRYVIHQALYDPHFLTESADALEDSGIEMIEFPQTPGRMGIATAKFREHVVDGLVEHDADVEVAKHVANAVTVEAGETMWRVSKGKTKGKIDGLIAMLLALDGAENAFKNGTLDRPGVQIITGR